MHPKRFLLIIACLVPLPLLCVEVFRLDAPRKADASGTFNTITVKLKEPLRFDPRLVIRGRAVVTADAKPLYLALNLLSTQKKRGFLKPDGGDGAVDLVFEASFADASVVKEAGQGDPWSTNDFVGEISVYAKFASPAASMLWLDALTVSAEAKAPGKRAKLSEVDRGLVSARVPLLGKNIPTDHPRLLVLKKEWPEFRVFLEKAKADPLLAPLTRSMVIEPVDAPLIPEPPRLSGSGAARAKMWSDAFQSAFRAAATAQQFAFAYLVTGEARYGRESARWLTHVLSWDVQGGIEIRQNDEAFIQSLRPSILAYDWAFDALTPEERRQCEAGLEARMQVLFPRVLRVYQAGAPTDPAKAESHAMRFISTIGLAGVALHRECAEAPTWLAWAYEYYRNQFPVWGGAEGGYSEGLEYWSSGHNQHFMFLDSMKALGAEELFARPYFQSNGYFCLYNMLPNAYSSFGDLCQVKVPTLGAVMHIEKYALLNENPYFMKFRDLLFENYPTGVNYYNYSFFDSLFQAFRRGQKTVAPRELGEMPRSRAFGDIGWVALHARLGSRSDDIHFGLKSSPYGSCSHSFADQNSFVLNAFGEVLAISSGYREWYGSPHHYGWAKQTHSKNAILFGGQGQRINDAKASGRIARFYTGAWFDHSSGDARAAYPAQLGVGRALRHAFFVRRRYVVMMDELAQEKPLSHQWLLHAREKMGLDGPRGEIVIRTNEANLTARLLVPPPAAWRLEQTDQSSVPVDAAYAARPAFRNEWHVTASTLDAREARDVVSVLYPWRRGESVPAMKMLEAKSGYVVDLSGDGARDLVFLARDGERDVECAEGGLRGLSAAVSREASGRLRFSMIEGTSFTAPGVRVKGDAPVSLEGEFEAKCARVELRGPSGASVEVTLPFAPGKAEGPAILGFEKASRVVRLAAGAQARYVFWAEAKPIIARLKSIRLDGAPLANFEPGVFDYEVKVEGKLPVVSADADGPGLKIAVTQAVKSPGTASILVLGEGHERLYAVGLWTGKAVAAPKGAQGVVKQAAGLKLRASSDDGNGPENLLDGRLDTRWSADGIGQWVEFAFPEPRDFSGMKIAFYRGNQRSTAFVVETSTDGNQYEPCFTGRSSGSSDALETYAFPKRKISWVRLVGKGNSENEWMSVSEVVFVP
jgi:hypothetical protein